MSSSSESKVVFITGASSGIGAALAKEYVRKGYSVFLAARRADKLEEVKKACLAIGSNPRIDYAVCDVCDPTSLSAAVEACTKRLGRINVLIANAGFGVGGRFERLTTDDYRRQFETNVFGLMDTIRSGLDSVKDTKGSLVLIGSVMSYFCGASYSPYCMSKFSVRALADSLYFEMKRYGVAVTLICPGLIKSEIRFVDNNGTFTEGTRDPAPQWLCMDTDVAAKKMIKAIDRRKREAVITRHGQLLVWITRHFPVLLEVFVSFLKPRRQKEELAPNS